MENPALKLHTILESILSFEGNQYLKTALISTFKTPINSTHELINHLYYTQKLVEETILLVEQYERLNNAKNQKALHSIQQAFSSLDFNDSVYQFNTYISEATLVALSYIADSIDDHFNFSNLNIDSNTVSELQNEIEELIKNISESNLPAEAKALLINNLSSIKVSLYQYTLFGEQELQKALEKTIGSIFVNNSTLTEISDDQNVSRFFGIIDKLNSVLELGNSVTDTVLPFVKQLMIK
ncbi:hypothetical protein CSE16_08720 [Solibacillus sp. R5-41]|uniref:hypothetical protein n=1 Tax=Solibacillus sp. R5-41 TaxID=2048654 RepID=UPI000C128E1C|nr:hypothetical protein [Solibacillus sp. R5-41]ATP40127.1 hypothetical protein CSE16_08720 [Solibacillus sp. R5-41]